MVHEIVSWHSFQDSSTDSNEEVKQEIPLNQQRSRTPETNSEVTSAPSTNRMFYINSTYPACKFGFTLPARQPLVTEPDNEDDQPMVICQDKEVTSPTGPSPLQSNGWPDNSSEVMDGLFSRALAFADELIRSLPSQTEPPGRLPVSICPPSDRSTRRPSKKRLMKKQSRFWKLREMPSKYRTDNSHGLPSMEMSEVGIAGWLDKVTAHLAFFAEKLMDVMTSAEDAPDSLDYDMAFKLFKEEFLAFDDMVAFCLKWLEPSVAQVLGERRKEVKSMFWKLEVASLNGGMYHQEYHIYIVAKDIQRVQESICSIYT